MIITCGFLLQFLPLKKTGRPDLEVHLGVKVSGRTPVGVLAATVSRRLLHEFDLLVLAGTDADSCRAGDIDPDYTVVVVHAEMKYYGGNLSLPAGRASACMAVECALAGKSALVTNQLGYTVQDLVEHHSVTIRYRVLLANPTAEYCLVQRFRALLLLRGLLSSSAQRRLSRILVHNWPVRIRPPFWSFLKGAA